MGLYVGLKKAIASAQTNRFGTSLESLLAREPGAKVPSVVIKICEHLRTVAKTEGQQIFCLGADKYRVNSLKLLLDAAPDLNQFDFWKHESPVIVDVLRLFLLELPRPLLIKENCENVFTDENGTLIDLGALKMVIQQLSKPRLYMLIYISALLSESGLHPSILAQTWGHTIYRGVSETVNSALQLTEVTTVIRALLLHYRDLCGLSNSGSTSQFKRTTSAPMNSISRPAAPLKRESSGPRVLSQVKQKVQIEDEPSEF